MRAAMIILAPLIPAALKLELILTSRYVMVVNIMIGGDTSIWFNDVSYFTIIEHKVRGIYERNSSFYHVLLVLLMLTYIPDIVLFLPNFYC